LAKRLVRSLSRGETRAIALVEALTSSQVRVLLIEEPFCAIDPRAACQVAEALRAKARSGCAIVVATASMRDASEIATDHIILKAGVVIGRVASLEPLMGFSPDGSEAVMLVGDVQQALALAAEIARAPEVSAVEHHGAVVRARGSDPLALARAAARAAIETRVAIAELRLQPPSLEEARAASAGIAAATHANAYERMRTSLSRAPAGSTETDPARAR
jgi:ABC-type multidrug transport system ATPase subunit